LVYTLADEYEVESKVVEGNSYITTCVKGLRIEEEHDEFNNVPDRDSIAWTGMITRIF
jgi:hypothetical protein